MKNGPMFIWEQFANEPRKLGCKGTALEQTMEFNMQVAFEENLLEAGFEPDEAVAVYIVDSELRMPPEAPKPLEAIENATIYLE
jgi:hypothetical protein